MSVPTRLPFYSTTIGKKVVMAVTGIVMLGFVLVHMAGNLQVFAGAARLNAYGALLKASPPFLWTFRSVMLLAVVLHVWSAVLLTLQSWRSRRPYAYAQQRWVESDLGARSMRWGGVFLGCFVVIHLLQFTVGTLYPGGGFGPTEIYRNVTAAFSLWYVAAFYVVSMTILALHVYHGAWSVFQTLGVNHPAFNCWRRTLATLFMVVVIGGFLAVPAAGLAGMFK